MRNMIRLLMVCGIASMIVSPLSAAEVPGRIVSVNRLSIYIRAEAEVAIKVGYEVRVGFEAPNGEFLAVPGIWKIVGTGDNNTYRAVPKSAEHGTPRVGNQVKITIGETSTTVDDDNSLNRPLADPESLYERGHERLFETEDTTSWAAGFLDLKRAAEIGHLEAIYEVGVAISSGRGTTKNPALSAEWFLKGASQGHVMSQYNLAYQCLIGIGIDKDPGCALKWFRKAADNGVPQAYTRLGDIYHNGEGVERDDTSAAEWYGKAYEAGDPSGTYNLGMLYLDGKGVARDYSEALRLFNKAAVQGNVMALYNLGLMYEEGLGVPQDTDTAIHYYQDAADKGSTLALIRLEQLK